MRAFRSLGIAIVVVAGIALHGVANATVFNAVTDFSLTTNTAANTWSYWTSSSTNVSTYPATIALAPFLFNTTCGFGTSCWDSTASTTNLLLQNVTGSDGPFPNGIARNDQLSFYTRSGLTLLRFLAPSAGSYTVKGFFEGSATNPEVTQELIAVNDNVASPQLNITKAEAFGAINPFSFTVALGAGGTVDFLVAGITTTPDLNSLTTGFAATITSGATSVPELGTWAMMVTGFALVGARLRRRRAQPASV